MQDSKSSLKSKCELLEKNVEMESNLGYIRLSAEGTPSDAHSFNAEIAKHSFIFFFNIGQTMKDCETCWIKIYVLDKRLK